MSTCIAATEMLEDAVEEMERRGGVVRESNRPRLRWPASAPVFTPLILIVDEAQNAFMSPAVGPDKSAPTAGSKNTSRYFMAARKNPEPGPRGERPAVAGHPGPDQQNLPKLVREGAHIRAALALGTEEQARMALGDKAVNAGAAPHKLRQRPGQGTVVVAGDGVDFPVGEPHMTVWTHFIDGDDATAIAERAKTPRTR